MYEARNEVDDVHDEAKSEPRHPHVKFLQSHPPITETFRFCLIVYLYNMFQPSTGSSSGTNELNYQNDFPQFQKLIKHLKNLKLIKSKSNIKSN